jgi:enoyl-[acyl-carrier protein] reductase II
MENKVNALFGITYPIIQAGMVWCSGWELASAVSNSGGLGLIGAGSMYPEVLRTHLKKCKAATQKPFGVNVPLLYPDIEKHMAVIAEEGIKIVFTSAGNPKTWTPFLKEKGITVVHVVSSLKFAQKSAESGVDAIVIEGFEAGGHNGRDETTTFCLLQLTRNHIQLPLIVAGGIGTGRGILGAMAMGADGVQVGTRFAASLESSANINFKNRVIQAEEGETVLTMKSVTPVRLLKNKFYEQIKLAEQNGASAEEIKSILGKGRAKKGIFEGDLDEGELEIGQISAAIKELKPAGEILKEMWEEYVRLKQEFCCNS